MGLALALLAKQSLSRSRFGRTNRPAIFARLRGCFQTSQGKLLLKPKPPAARFPPQTHAGCFSFPFLSRDSSHGPSSLVGRHCGTKSLLFLTTALTTASERTGKPKRGLSEGGTQGRQTDRTSTHPSINRPLSASLPPCLLC